MAYDDKYRDDKFRPAETTHNLIVEARGRAAVSGVTDVESFDENEIIMATSMGALFLRGTELRIEKLSLDTGDVAIEGNIDKIEYEDGARERDGGFFRRLFR
ncbi:MAG: sporulation protein YabP [Oscillospiraceae bacterium]|jgi:sporulation protein YabP|nr:sporulation protein YabP [Oscillospiraceae bacterium]